MLEYLIGYNPLRLLSFVWDFLLFLVIFAIAIYLLLSLFMYMIGKKYRCDSTFPPYLLPFYRYYLIIKHVGCNEWLLLGLSLNQIGSLLFWFFGINKIVYLIFGVLYIITSICFGYLWGKVAESMGKNCVGWGILGGVCALLFIPSLLPPAIFALSEMCPLQSTKAEKPKYADVARMQTMPAASVQDVKNLYAISGMYKGQLIPFSSPIVIGRDPAIASLIIDSPDVSRKHAKISPAGGSVKLEDLGSSNGTFYIIGGVAAKVSGQVALNTGDRFYLGTKTNMFEIR